MPRCSYCHAAGATHEIVWNRAGIEHTMFIVCEDRAACKEREQFALELIAPEPWHTMQAEVSRFINLTI